MKKLLSLAILSSGAFLITNPTINTNSHIAPNLKSDLQSLSTTIKTLEKQPDTIKVLSRYVVSVNDEYTQDIDTSTIDDEYSNEPITTDNEQNKTANPTSISDHENEKNDSHDYTLEEDIDDDSSDTTSTDENYSIYSLSEDINQSCDEFCELKEEILEAIIDTEKLLEKVNSNELSLSPTEKTYLKEQVSQLNVLGKELVNVTNSLSFELSSLGEMIRNGENEDMTALKYLIILENLNNGNSTLRNGLSTLNMINRMNFVPSRMIYGYKMNDQDPIIKDYTINENGDLNENITNDEDKSTDTYNNTNLVSNIDTYGNYYRNIDSFFNTALLDNEFMYGTGFGAGYGMYPFISNYTQYEKGNQTTNNINHNNINTTNNTETTISSNKEDKANKKKRNVLQKNIDTFKNENTPDLKTRFNNIKTSINGFFSKFKKPNQNIENPIYRQDIINEESEEI